MLTVDAPRLGRRERDLRTEFRIPAEVLVPSVAAAEGGWHGATPLEIMEVIQIASVLGAHAFEYTMPALREARNAGGA